MARIPQGTRKTAVTDPETAARASTTGLPVAAYIDAVRREGEALAGVAARTPLDAPIPTCSDWRLCDLLRHLGGVHRWATTYITTGRAQAMDAREEEALMASWPDDGALIDWFRAGHATLVQALETAPPNLACWTFLPAPTPLVFWARRQAHETGIHRADVESASGPISAFAPAIATDGIDELLYGFASRPGGTLRADPPQTLRLHATDTRRGWLVCIGPTGIAVCDGMAGENGDGTVRGNASNLFLLLWNRGAADALEVDGDAALLDLWRRSVRIRWS
jgi:uncharacterized protein (TIGR03083 family)